MREQKTIHFEGYSWLTNRSVEVYAYPSDEGLSIYSRDITERKRANEQLAYHSHLLEHVHDAVMATDERLVVTAWNKGAEQMYGWGAHEVLGRNVWEAIRPEMSDEERVAAVRELAEAGQRRAEVITYRKDGTPIYAECRSVALRGKQGQITGYLGINRDITERKRAEWERAQLLRRLMAAQEDERRRIAREMHDQLGQQLTALTLKLAALKGAHVGQTALGEQLVALEAIARQLDEDLDFLIWEMRPTTLDDLGLVVALSNYVETWSKHFGVRAALHASGMDQDRLTSDVETVLYRVTQESLTNIAKHASAGNVDILLERRSDHVSLIIEDDGVGFDAEKTFDTAHTRLGLIGMRERAALVDGKLEIESSPGNGTTVVVRIRAPVVPKREEKNEKIKHSLGRRS
jgi:PAS domain S-box-containing protein